MQHQEIFSSLAFGPLKMKINCSSQEEVCRFWIKYSCDPLLKFSLCHFREKRPQTKQTDTSCFLHLVSEETPMSQFFLENMFFCELFLPIWFCLEQQHPSGPVYSSEHHLETQKCNSDLQVLPSSLVQRWHVFYVVGLLCVFFTARGQAGHLTGRCTTFDCDCFKCWHNKSPVLSKCQDWQ